MQKERVAGHTRKPQGSLRGWTLRRPAEMWESS
jgi:hypothetical protein